jgi:hypothetical protein
MGVVKRPQAVRPCLVLDPIWLGPIWLGPIWLGPIWLGSYSSTTVRFPNKSALQVATPETTVKIGIRVGIPYWTPRHPMTLRPLFAPQASPASSADSQVLETTNNPTPESDDVAVNCKILAMSKCWRFTRKSLTGLHFDWISGSQTKLVRNFHGCMARGSHGLPKVLLGPGPCTEIWGPYTVDQPGPPLS